MKFYSITIKPTSPFGTPLKGDTIFGHFCWQAAENEFLNGGIDSWITKYKDTPFAVFSSAFPKVTENGRELYVLPRPFLPSSPAAWQSTEERYQHMTKRKKDKKKKHLLVGDDLAVQPAPQNYRSDEELFQLHIDSIPLEQKKELRLLTGKQRKLSGKFVQAHNTINRETMTTGTGRFAPFSSENIHFLPGLKLVVFVLFDEEATDIGRIEEGFANIGNWGFGRDASAGLGRFQVIAVRQEKMPAGKKGSCYTLSPCVPEAKIFKTAYFTPFTRFGKHGAALLAAGKPFKNPVVMADEGAVFTPTDAAVFDKPYIGRALTGLSKADDRTVMQGYAIYLNCDIEKIQ